MFDVKFAKFLMSTVSEGNTVTFLEGSSDNGRTPSLVFGNLRQHLGIVGSLRKSPEIIRNCRKMVENSLIY